MGSPAPLSTKQLCRTERRKWIHRTCCANSLSPRRPAKLNIISARQSSQTVEVIPACPEDVCGWLMLTLAGCAVHLTVSPELISCRAQAASTLTSEIYISAAHIYANSILCAGYNIQQHEKPLPYSSGHLLHELWVQQMLSNFKALHTHRHTHTHRQRAHP